MTLNRRPLVMLMIIGALLAIPLIAMQFTAEVNWTVMDFVIMGAMLLGLALAIELILRNVKKSNHRLALGVLAVVLFLLAWAELAVGIFETPFAGS